MSRPKAFTDAHFIRNLPNREDEAITAKELSPLVGCKLSATQKWLKTNVDSGMVALGKPANMGALTYYLVTSRPDNWVPQFTHPKTGQMFDIKAWAKNSAKVTGINKPIMESILTLWIGACSDEVKFTEVNQEERVKLQQYRASLQGALKFLDSVLNEPFLAGNSEEVLMSQDAIRAVSGDINLEEVIDKRNALRD